MITQGHAGQWFYTTTCLFRVEGDKVYFHSDSLAEKLVGAAAMPGRIHRNSICMDMPEAAQYTRSPYQRSVVGGGYSARTKSNTSVSSL